jgi:hypothetical protein
VVDVVNPPQDLPSGDHHLPCRDVCEAGPIHDGEAAIIDEANESSEVIRDPGPMKITVNLMREIFSDGEDDRDSVFYFAAQKDMIDFHCIDNLHSEKQ